MQAVTITQISPPELELLIENSIKKVLGSQLLKQQQSHDQWLTLPELCNYLPDKPARVTVYGWVQNRAIPFHKGAKKLQFLKSEIDAWAINGRQRPIIEPENFNLSKPGQA